MDIIGHLRAVNVLLFLLRIKEFSFPLDDLLRSLLDEYRPQFLRMIDLVSGLANFGDMKDELLSSVDDVLDPASNTYYTRDYLDMLLSLYGGKQDVEHLRYENVPGLRNHLAAIIRLNVCELLQSVIWVRIAFYSCYPRVGLASLRESWAAVCKTVCAVGGNALCLHPQSLAVSSLESWRLSDIVCASLEKKEDDMPHKDAIAKAVVEVDEAMKVV